ncbi:MAG: YqeG family HAD IIIA-type phosphatase [bacterium]
MTLLTPHYHCATVADVPLEDLWNHGVRGLLLDIDNTIACHGQWVIEAEVRDWIAQAIQRGFRIALYSNARTRRIRRVAADLGVEVAARAYKPFNASLKAILAEWNLTPQQVAITGDQLFTDVLAGKWGGLTVILIEPLSQHEWPHTQLLRAVEVLLGRRRVGIMRVLGPR